MAVNGICLLYTSGKWEKKSEVEYICKRGDEEKRFTADEFNTEKDNGWEKQYKYVNGKEKVWLTKSEGEAMGLETVSYTHLDVYKRQAEV